MRILHGLVTEFFTTKWSRSTRVCEKMSAAIADIVEASNLRSPQGKAMFHNASFIACALVTLHDPREMPNKIVTYTHEVLGARLNTHLMCLDGIQPSRLIKKYIRPYVNDQLLRLLSLLHNLLKTNDRKTVSLVIQYILSLPYLSHDATLCIPINDDYGLFADIPSEIDKTDPVWMIWFLLILHTKQQLLRNKKQRDDPAINQELHNIQYEHWQYIDALVKPNFFVYKAMYAHKERNHRTQVLLQLFDVATRPTLVDKTSSYKSLFKQIDKKVQAHFKATLPMLQQKQQDALDQSVPEAHIEVRQDEVLDEETQEITHNEVKRGRGRPRQQVTTHKEETSHPLDYLMCYTPRNKDEDEHYDF